MFKPEEKMELNYEEHTSRSVMMVTSPIIADKNYETQSAAVYTPKDLNNSKPSISNHGLRKTHFILGSYPINYLTTIKDQNKDIEGHNFSKKMINMSEVKRDLAKSHFSLGNEDTNYKSEVMSEFIDKSKQNLNHESFNKGKEVRKQNIIVGEDLPDYLSQTKITYTHKIGEIAKMSDEKRKDLHKNHYQFGYSNEPLINSSNNNFAKVFII